MREISTVQQLDSFLIRGDYYDMNFLLPINMAPEVSPFLIKFSNHLVSNGHKVTLYLSTKAAYEILNRFPIKNNVNIITKEELLRLVTPNKFHIENDKEFSWLYFYPSWDRKVLWHKTLKLSKKEYEEIIAANFKIIWKLFEIVKPDVVIQEMPANFLTWTIYHISKFFDAKYFGLIGSRIPGRTDIYDTFEDQFTNSKYSEYYRLPITKGEINYYSKIAENFALGKLKPEYEKLIHVTIHKRSLLIYYSKRLKNVLKYRLQLIKEIPAMRKIYDYEGIATAISTLKLLGPINALKRKWNYLLYVKHLEINPNLKEKYYVFPLHYQPEASVSVLSPFYCDLQSTIRYIAFSLPFPYKLYVKEHPHAVGIRGKNFFREISKIPNVKLIHPEANNVELIENSQGVITLTSTLGLQAAILGKPVYVLGKVFYTFHPNVRKVNSIDELYYVLNHEPLEPLTGDRLKESNARFMRAYYEASADVDLINIERNTERNYEDLLNKIFLLLNKG